MKLYYKGVYTIEEQLLILSNLKNKPDGEYLIHRSKTTHIPKIERLN